MIFGTRMLTVKNIWNIILLNAVKERVISQFYAKRIDNLVEAGDKIAYEYGSGAGYLKWQ